MAKPTSRLQSRYSHAAIQLLGQMVRRARIEQKMTTVELAERVGISRGLVQRIEKGDPGCTIGPVFEAAAILGIPLFDAGQTTITKTAQTYATILKLLPKAVRTRQTEADDDF